MREIEYTLLIWISLVLAAFASKFPFFFLRIRLGFLERRVEREKLFCCKLVQPKSDDFLIIYPPFMIILGLKIDTHYLGTCLVNFGRFWSGEVEKMLHNRFLRRSNGLGIGWFRAVTPGIGLGIGWYRPVSVMSGNMFFCPFGIGPKPTETTTETMGIGHSIGQYRPVSAMTAHMFFNFFVFFAFWSGFFFFSLLSLLPA